MGMLRNILIVMLLGARVSMADAPSGQMPRYVFVNRAPGVAWSAGHPQSFTAERFEEIPNTLACPENPLLRIGVTFVFDFFRYDPKALRESLERFLALSEETGIPVLVQLDGQNWWGYRSDLWNWWDPRAPGYNPANVLNVEWTGWEAECAVKICWRNWGRQVRVLPAPNLASPAVLKAHREALDKLVPVITAWWQQLPTDRKYLLGGVKVGHEAGIGYNAYHYPDGNRYLEQPVEADPQYGLDLDRGLGGGLAQLGYAAVKTAGIADHGAITREQIGEVTRRYLAFLSRACVENGLPPSLVYTHQGGTYAPWGKHLPFTAACNPHATPGWSFYGLDPRAAKGMEDAFARQGNERWAAVEWWWGAPGEAGWYRHFRDTLTHGDCRFISIFNWNCGFSFKREAAGQRALRRLVETWTGG